MGNVLRLTYYVKRDNMANLKYKVVYKWALILKA